MLIGHLEEQTDELRKSVAQAQTDHDRLAAALTDIARQQHHLAEQISQLRDMVSGQMARKVRIWRRLVLTLAVVLVLCGVTVLLLITSGYPGSR